jgi:hypothetical protein
VRAVGVIGLGGHAVADEDRAPQLRWCGAARRRCVPCA